MFSADYCVHGVSIQIRTDLPEIVCLLHRRLEYFAAPPAAPAFVFELRRSPEEEVAGLGPPPGETRRLMRGAGTEVLYSIETGHLYLGYSARLKVWSAPPEGARTLISGCAAEHLWRITHPLFTLPFVDLMQRRSRFCLHAAGLETGGRGFLFPGVSGAGKSTLTLALLRAGFGFLGDDMVFLCAGEDRLRLLPFPEAIDVAAGTEAMFPELRPYFQDPPDSRWPKRQLPPGRPWGRPVVTECRPAAVVFPRVAHAERSALAPLSPLEAFQELAANVLLTEGDAAQAHLGALARLVREVPCFRLHTGRDLDAVPQLLREGCA